VRVVSVMLKGMRWHIIRQNVCYSVHVSLQGSVDNRQQSHHVSGVAVGL